MLPKRDGRVEQVAMLLASMPAALYLMVTQAMRAKGFSKKEIANCTMQQRVQCCAKELVDSTNDQQQTLFTHSNPLIPSTLYLNAAPSLQSNSRNHDDDVSEMTEFIHFPSENIYAKHLCKPNSTEQKGWT